MPWTAAIKLNDHQSKGGFFNVSAVRVVAEFIQVSKQLMFLFGLEVVGEVRKFMKLQHKSINDKDFLRI